MANAKNSQKFLIFLYIVKKYVAPYKSSANEVSFEGTVNKKKTVLAIELRSLNQGEF